MQTLRLVLSVRKYVESMGDKAAQLLDLLSAEGDEIEPTRAQSSSKQALYPEVALTQASYERSTLIPLSTFPYRRCWPE